MAARTQLTWFSPSRRGRGLTLFALTLVLFTGLRGSAAAQSVVDPTILEFDPSADHNALLSDGRPKVDHYELELRNAATSAVIQHISLGKPAIQSDGKIRVNLTALLGANLPPGVLYSATVAAVGPAGSAASSQSNSFSFSPCTPWVTPKTQTIASDAALGGTNGMFSVRVKNTCMWSAVSDASWLHVARPTGAGDGTVGYTTDPNTTGEPRTASVAISGAIVTVTQLPSTQTHKALDDFDHDGRSDVAVYRPSTGEWIVRPSHTGFAIAGNLQYQWGLVGDQAVPGDYDGDGQTDLAVYRPTTGEWFLNYSSRQYDRNFYRSFQWGLAGDVPVVADFDGDGRTDIAIYRPSTGEWHILYSSQNFDRAGWGNFQWGLPGDVPITGDFDGDGKSELAVYRPTTGDWWVRYSATSYATHEVFQWGLTGDLPVAADYDGDGRVDIVVYRPSDGQWFFRYSGSNYELANWGVRQWGMPGDQPVVGDFDGDGLSEVAVYRPASGEWFFLSSTHDYARDGYGVFQWGLTNDLPIGKP